MTELLILDEADSLEEGEILDDCEVEIIDDPKLKAKKLPRRYTLHSNKANSKHKKNYKHISHHQLEERSKPHKINGTYKRHKSSCKHHTIGQNYFSGSQNPTGNFSTLKFSRKNNQYDLSFPAVKSAFKNFKSPPRPVVKEKSPIPSNCQEIEIVDNYPQLLLEYKKVRHQKQNCVKLNNEDSRSEHSRQSEVKHPLKEVKLDASVINEISQEQSLSETEADNEVEELRKIALATVGKNQAEQQKHQEGVNLPTDLNSGDSHSQPPFNSHDDTLIDCDNRSSDNYDIVDMEIDSESVDDLYKDSDLFVIDKNPTALPQSQESLTDPYIPNHIGNNLSVTNNELPLDTEQYLPSSHSKNKEDFEAELLRAEAIASLYQKLNSVPKRNSPEKSKLPEFPKKDLNRPSMLPITQKTSTHFQSVFNSTNKIIKRAVKTQMKFSKLPSAKITVPPPRSITAGQERLIITLNNDDTTTDESEDESDKKSDAPENVAVASIEALISDARQKSDINKVNSGDTNTVSCLSKAQQEEYNSLKRILAEKEPFLMSSSPPVKDKEEPKQEIVVQKSNVQISLKKIAVAKGNLVKEMEAMNNIAKELQRKKQMYMTSKLKAQHLKEQLHAAEVVKTSHLNLWKKCSAKLDILKMSVLKREAMIKQLETQLNNQSS